MNCPSGNCLYYTDRFLVKSRFHFYSSVKNSRSQHITSLAEWTYTKSCMILVDCGGGAKGSYTRSTGWGKV